MDDESVNGRTKVLKNELEKCVQAYTKCYKRLNINTITLKRFKQVFESFNSTLLKRSVDKSWVSQMSIG
jgi:hypothetical protein